VVETRRAAFEIDGIDPEQLSGWSVIASGVCEEITTPAELRRLETAASEPWAPGLKHRWFGIRVVTVSGRRVVAGASTTVTESRNVGEKRKDIHDVTQGIR
jgi:hypothetical protein